MSFVRNENVQYFALAFYWYSYHPITGLYCIVCHIDRGFANNTIFQ